MMLNAHHRAMLMQDRAIAAAIIAARGYQSLLQPADLIDRRFSKTQAKTAPALGIPLWDVHGQQAGWQIRPDAPRQMRDGKLNKYELPAGDRLILDVHPRIHPLLGDPTTPLWIAEGVPKGDALVSQGQCALALVGGVWGFRGTNEHGGKVILPDWEYVALNGRQVRVVFDSDLHVNPAVEAALKALYRLLRERHAIPALVRWLEEYRQTKVGVDDFFAQGHTLEELLAMLPPSGPLPVTFTPAQRNGHALQPQRRAEALLTDTYNAAAFVADYGPIVRYCYPWKAWLVWTGTHWQRDTSGEVMRLAKATVKKLAQRIEGMDDDKKIADLFGHIKVSLSTAKLKALLENAQSEPGIAVQPEDLDRDPWLLNCKNGTLDLRTGTLRPHQQADLLTKCLQTAYDAEATCPTWEAFQWRIMGGSQDADSPDMSVGALEARQQGDDRAARLIRFKQRYTGYALTGDTREQCLCLYHGSGSNGKTTEIETLKALFEDYAQSTPSASLLVKERHDAILNDIARLRGARLVTTVEIGEGKRLDEELVKRLTGQDTMTARFLHAEFFDFIPQFKLIIACNHLPHIRGTDHAIWRRLHRLPFTVTIPDDEQDKALPMKLRAELPGILRWLVQGCLDWQREGLGVPEEVQAADHDYRAAMDVVGRFIEECCIVHTQVQVRASELYEAYKRWCDTSGEYAVTLTAFGLRLEDKGFQKRLSGGAWRLGIGLLSSKKDL